VAGRADDPANFITLTLPWVAVYGEAGHFFENGTPRAGHEQDTLGPCGGGGGTTTEPTTPTETETTPPGERCPPGMTPTAGKDGEPGNDECEFPQTETTPTVEETTPPVETTAPPVVVTPPVTTPVVDQPEKPEAAKPPVTEEEAEKGLEKQAKKNGASNPATHAVNESELPFTGLPLWAFSIFGLGMLGSGVRLFKL